MLVWKRSRAGLLRNGLESKGSSKMILTSSMRNSLYDYLGFLLRVGINGAWY